MASYIQTAALGAGRGDASSLVQGRKLRKFRSKKSSDREEKYPSPDDCHGHDGQARRPPRGRGRAYRVHAKSMTLSVKTGKEDKPKTKSPKSSKGESRRLRKKELEGVEDEED